MLSFAPQALLIASGPVNARNKRFHGSKLLSHRVVPSPIRHRRCDERVVAIVRNHDVSTPLSPADEASRVNASHNQAQLEKTLQLLQDRVAMQPQESEESAIDDLLTAKETKKEFTSEQLLHAVSMESTAKEGYDDEFLTDEQKVLLSVIGDEDDVTSSSYAAADAASIIDAVEQISSQAHPPADARPPEDSSLVPAASSGDGPYSSPARTASLKLQLDAVKRRRQHLSAGRVDEEQSASNSTGPVREILQRIEREEVKAFVSNSLAAARVIRPEKDVLAPRTNARTAAANELIARSSRCPFISSPFPGMQAAFDALEIPPCPRCGSPTWMYHSCEPISPNSLCQSCYKAIYLIDASHPPAGEMNQQWEDSEMREERILEEARIAEKAVNLSRRLLHRPGEFREDVSKDTAYVTMASTGAQGQATTPKSEEVVQQTGGAWKQSSASGNDNPPLQRSRPRDGEDWDVQASVRSLRTINPIRNLVQNMKVEPNPDKKLIKLSIGDPTVYGNLKVSEKAIDKYCEAIRSRKSNGYSLSMGGVEARSAVAKRYSTTLSPLSVDDIFLTGGTSGALELALGALANEGDNILLPSPGFPLFVTLAENYGIECRFYRVNPDSNWEIELSDLIELADSRTAAILVNNPSNPCGSVYSESHIEDLLATASALKLPIIADEVYADMVFSGQDFVSVGTKSVDVPVLCVGGVSKQFVVPGWRLGWILVHDRNGVFQAGGVQRGIQQLTTRMLVPNTPAQAALPTLLEEGTHDASFQAVMEELEMNAKFTVKSLANAKGLRVIEPQGSMYVMAEVDVELLGLKDDMDFTEKLLEEEAVFVLPGRCFRAPNFVRIVFAAPREVLSEAFFRIRTFCSRRCGGM